MSLPIYLDNHATTRTDPRVLEAMLPFFGERYGNAASRTHRFGQDAAEAVQVAREQVAELIGARPREIVFTSGATESNNLALKGVANMYRRHGNHIVTVCTEHKAVLDPCRRLEQVGFEVTYLPVDRDGLISVDALANALTPRTILVSVMAANNEIGVLAPLAEIGRLCKDRGILFHTDAAQAAATIPLNVDELGVDLLSLSAHKMYGPKGVGALYVRRRNPHVRLEPQLDGGGHEGGLRSGTLPVPLLVGFGVACQLCRASLATEADRLRRLRDRLYHGILDQLEDVVLNGHPTQRLPGNLNLSFAHVRGEALLMSLYHELAVSSGSACTSANPEPSYVLKALGLDDELAHASLRFGLGRFTTEAEIDFAIDAVVRSVRRLRAISPSYHLARASDLQPAVSPRA
ncbi:MAG: IscS subfamily cysteine desulfurase [Gemmataceae bacterium]|nr:IscS subfamily cysteine desulfurase [Gemmataceae bacterium]